MTKRPRVESAGETLDPGVLAALAGAAAEAAGSQDNTRRLKKKSKSKKKRAGPECRPVSAGALEAADQSIAPHPFPSEYGDHFETPLVAYQHLAPFLELVARQLRKPLAQLRVFDPFFCQGAAKGRLGQVGCHTVVHENVDFWARVRDGAVPAHDVLVTNPPFSGDHKERIVRFCVGSGKPWALLMPTYVAVKSYFAAALATVEPPAQPAFLCPFNKYQFSHPEGTGHDDSPFDSMWFAHAGSPGTLRGLTAPAGCDLLLSVGELKERRKVPTQKRLNPRQRKAAAKRRAQGTS